MATDVGTLRDLTSGELVGDAENFKNFLLMDVFSPFQNPDLEGGIQVKLSSLCLLPFCFSGLFKNNQKRKIKSSDNGLL